MAGDASVPGEACCLRALPALQDMGRIRVVAGDFRGRRLFSPLGHDVRPTSDKVKEALFNILASKIAGASFLDLYAGSGAIGIEAISRGAAHVVFVENNKKNFQLIKKNLLLFPCSEGVTLFEGTAIDFLRQNRNPFDIIYMDPPYNTADLEKILPILERYDIMRPQGLVIIEHFHKTTLPDSGGVLSFLKRYRYGGTALSVYVQSEHAGRLSGHV